MTLEDKAKRLADELGKLAKELEVNCVGIITVDHLDDEEGELISISPKGYYQMCHLITLSNHIDNMQKVLTEQLKENESRIIH